MTRRTLLYAALAPRRPMDVFVLVGQSNMAGRGVPEAQDRKPLPRVYMLTKAMEWSAAVDPMHFDKPEIAGVGLGRSFAHALAKLDPKAEIGLVPCAMGGSALDEWKPDGKLYTNAVSRARKAIEAGRLRGILWHQGEADSNNEAKAQSYTERWKANLGSFRKEIGAEDTPIVVGQLGEFLSDTKYPYKRMVNEQQALLPLSVPRVAWVSSAGLKHKGDDVHFDTPSLREFGRRYAMAYLSLDPAWGAGS